jgi:hypothetical protein
VIQKMLDIIGHRVKILFTSRPHTPIRLNITDVEIALDRQYSEKDIIDYAKDGLSKLEDLKLPIELRDEIQKVLIEGANGMFLWVSLILDDLQNSKETTISAIQTKLKALPKDLPKLYRSILNKVEPDDMTIAKTTSMGCWAARPLHVRELAVAIAIRPEHTSISSMQKEIDFNLERRIRLILGPLIKIEDETVYLVHQSAKDFLPGLYQIHETVLDKNTVHCTTSLMLSSDESHLQIASTCLAFLAFDEIEDCGQPIVRQTVNELQTEMHQQCETQIISYAVHNWRDHVNLLSQEGQLCSRILASFENVAKSPNKIHVAYVGYPGHQRNFIAKDSSPLVMEAYLGHTGFVNILINIAVETNTRPSTIATHYRTLKLQAILR